MTSFIRRYWLSLSALLLALITAFSLNPFSTLPDAPGSDKTHHLIAYAALALPTALRKPKRWRFIILCFLIYSGLIELIQPRVNRHGEWMDFIANVFGLFIGVSLAYLLNYLQITHKSE